MILNSKYLSQIYNLFFGNKGQDTFADTIDVFLADVGMNGQGQDGVA